MADTTASLTVAGQQPLLELERITQRYGLAERRFSAVENVSLRLVAGEFVALLGPSGCGKSTLLRIVTGLQRPSEGTVRYAGKVLTGVNPQAAIVFQTFALFPWLTVQQNVEVALKAQGIPPRLRSPRAVALLDKVGLDGFENAYPRELSGGMRQKVGFARAMAVEPALLCLDEPFSALDVLSAEALRGELLELWLAGGLSTKAILLVTHNIEEAVFLASRIVVMDKNPGRVVAQLPVNLPHPRQRKSAAFNELVDRVYSTLAGETLPEHLELGTAPGEPGRTRGLPEITINDLSGLLEHLGELPGDRADIYRLADDLGADSATFLPLIEAAELLGFASVRGGDITLTTLGETYADASIQVRKQIFATRVRRLPLFRWLLEQLKAAPDRSMDLADARGAFEQEFPPEEAERQLDSAINWGRYAEVLAYDANNHTIYLEQGSAA